MNQQTGLTQVSGSEAVFSGGLFRLSEFPQDLDLRDEIRILVGEKKKQERSCNMIGCKTWSSW